MRLVDSHCHLDDAKFAGDLDEVLARARGAGVGLFVAVGTGDGPPDLEAGIRLAEKYPFVHATVGVHPHDAARVVPATYERLRKLAAHPKVVAIGEIGLDYHYDFSPRETQREVFASQLELAAEAGKPVAIHTREAWDDTLELLRLRRAGTGVMHCFTGGPEEARAALDLGFYLSFAGIVTFPKAEPVRASLRLTPDDRLLVETDAPYLAPIPHRGKRNEPAFLVHTVEKAAEIRGVDPEALARLTTRNFEGLCGTLVSFQ